MILTVGVIPLTITGGLHFLEAPLFPALCLLLIQLHMEHGKAWLQGLAKNGPADDSTQSHLGTSSFCSIEAVLLLSHLSVPHCLLIRGMPLHAALRRSPASAAMR